MLDTRVNITEKYSSTVHAGKLFDLNSIDYKFKGLNIKKIYKNCQIIISVRKTVYSVEIIIFVFFKRIE